MDEEEEVVPEDLETPVGDEDEPEDEPEDPDAPEDEPDQPEETEREKKLRLDNEELTKKNKQLFERAKKNGTKPTELTPKDALLLAKANVHEDDLETIIEFATFKKVPVADVLKDTTMQKILAGNAEERATAAASNRGGARGTSRVSGEDLLRKAETTGEVPDTTKGMNDLFLARQARKLPRKRK